MDSMNLISYTIITSCSPRHYFNCFLKLCSSPSFSSNLYVLAPLDIHHRLGAIVANCCIQSSNINIIDPYAFSDLTPPDCLSNKNTSSNQSREIKYLVPSIHRQLYPNVIVPFIYHDITLIPTPAILESFKNANLLFLLHPRFNPLKEVVYNILLSRIHPLDLLAYSRLLFSEYPLVLGGFYYSSGTTLSIRKLSNLLAQVSVYTAGLILIRDQVIISFFLSRTLEHDEFQLYHCPELTSPSRYSPFIQSTPVVRFFVAFKALFQRLCL